MIKFPYKKVIGLVGETRAGKDTIAEYLKETRDFEVFAFADKIKEECGITKEDFEVAKIAGNIENLRQKLWDFSTTKRKNDPFYFIRKVLNDAKNTEKSVIITDIRTLDELNAFFDLQEGFMVKRLYLVQKGHLSPDEDGFVKGTRLKLEFINGLIQDKKIKVLLNENNGLYEFFRNLDKLFFVEDVLDLSGFGYGNNNLKSKMISYLHQFEVNKK